MSASNDLQSAIAALLRGFVTAVGNGAATSFTGIAHGLGTDAVKVGVNKLLPNNQSQPLKRGVDFTAVNTAGHTVAVTSLIGAPAADEWEITITRLSEVFPIVARVSKSLENDIVAAVANQGLAISVMPMMPERCDEDVPFVFIERASIRVRIIEKVQTNQTPVDAYQIRDDVMTLLHYRPLDANDTPALTLGAMLAYPLTLANPPAQMMFESGTERVIDVIFNAVFQINAD
jgi:hypothetical protein